MFDSLVQNKRKYQISYRVRFLRPFFATIVATLVAMVLPLTAMDQLPFLRAVDLDIGETAILELADGQEATVALPDDLSRTRQTDLSSAVIEATSDHSEASALSQLNFRVGAL